MPTDNTGVQTRAMAQRTDSEPQETQNQNVNPTVEPHKNTDESIKDFVRKHGTIALDWYVPNFSNTRVGDLIEQRLPIETADGRIVFSCPTLSEFFKTSNFELDLKTGQVFTYLSPPENIGISCQKDPFDLELVRNMLREEQDISMTQEEALERIPNIKKLAGPADTMSLEETEQKIRQFCHLWKLYADISVELKKKSELSQDSAVAACRVYIPYMSDITRQLEEVRKIFAIEKELRTIKNRGYFPVLHINPQEEKIETAKDKDKTLERIDEIATAMIQAARQSEENFAREQEQARVRDEQLRSVRQTNRSCLNFFAQANSTPVRNDNSRADNQGVHFKANPTRHVYSTTSDDNNPYEPPENDSIIQTVSPPQTDQLTTSTTKPVNRNTPWRHNSNTGTTVGTVTHRTASVTATDNRSGPICFRCGERGHLRFNCTERVFCDFCKTFNHGSRACRKQTDNTPSPTGSQIATGYHPTATPPPLTNNQPPNNQFFHNLFENNQPRTSTMIQTPYAGASPTTPADLVEGITQIVNQATKSNKQDETAKQMMKNIKIFDGSNKAECINWISQVEAAAKFTNKPFRELICQSTAPAMLHIFSELSAMATDEDIKEAILTNYSDIPSTTEAATRLQNIQISVHEPLVTFNHRYEAIHKVAFGILTRQQENKTILIEYAKKLPTNTRDKLLRKLAKRNSYIKTLDDAFKQAIDINRESSFVEAATGQSNDQVNTRIDTQINELEDSFQDYDINAMSTRASSRSGDRSWNSSFDKPSQRNNSFNSSHSSRSNYRDNSYSSSEDNQNRQSFHRDNNRDKGYQQTPRHDQRNQHHQYRYDNNQDRNRFDNRRKPNKFQHHRNQHKAQIIFEFSDQNMMEMMQTVRGFINLIKANPTTRDHYKTNKLANRKYDNEVNESEIKTSNLDQVQQFFNEGHRHSIQRTSSNGLHR